MFEAIVVMLANYFHDLASGLLFGLVVARAVIAPSVADRQQLEVLDARWRRLFLGAFAAVALWAAPRAWFFDAYEWSPAAARGHTAGLIAKHVALATVATLSCAAGLWTLRRLADGALDDSA